MSGTVLQQLPKGARVAIIRLRSLGDCVLTTPAIALLKKARPDLRLAVVVEPHFEAVYHGNPDLDQFLPPTLTGIARWRPELTLNLHGGARSAQLAVASLARFRAGFAHYRFQSVYNVRIPRAQEILGVRRTVHTAEHVASAMFHLGVPATAIPRARLFAPALADSPPHAVIHPCASAADKTWPAERFREIARYLQNHLGLEPVFVAGPSDDMAPFAGFQVAIDIPRIKTLLAGASLFIGNDSGPAHMAAAFGVPVVVLFGSSDPEVWAPWKTEAVALTSPRGIGGIEIERVLDAISALTAQPVP